MESREIELSIDAAQVVAPLDLMWQSTGFTPAKLLLGKTMQQTLAFLGAVPHEGIKHVRIHDLLDLVEVDDPYADSPTWDWSKLDEGLDVLVSNNLQPFFELMGHPSGHFDDMSDEKQVHAWRRLVRDLANHLMDRYGRERVESWYFEVWNEPDTGKAFNPPWGMDEIPKLNNFYDACSVGLTDANPKLRFGGPGTAMGLSGYLKGILAHLDNGTCFFTGQTPRCDFLSVHVKGGWSVNPRDPSTDKILRDTLEIINYIRDNHPRLLELPLLNDECDPLIGWKDHHAWRAGPYYASIICRILDRHLHEVIDTGAADMKLISNDNGFLGGWFQRTHLANFSKGVGTCLIKKPALTVMTLLSLLGDERIACEGVGAPAGETVGCIATRRGEGQVAILVYHHADRTRATGRARIRLAIRGIEKGMMLTHWRLDGDHCNPFETWEQLGQPEPLSAEQAEALRDAAELRRFEEPRELETDGPTATLEMDLPMHAVSLLVLTAKPQMGPGRVANLRGAVYTGPGGDNELMLRWDPLPSRAVRTYEVLCDAGQGPRRINAHDLIEGGLLHVRPSGATCRYTVRAVDLWGRTGPESEPFEA